VTSSGLRRLLADFREAGGDALEVISPSHTADAVDRFSGLARTYGFRASMGSDYHGPGESPIDLGDLPDLPVGLVPVWKNW
jgi:predicted metal-dependent phosphoesterase TrpH